MMTGCSGAVTIRDDYKLEVPTSMVNCSWTILNKPGKVSVILYSHFYFYFYNNMLVYILYKVKLR